MEQALVERADIPYRGIDTGQLHGVNPWATLVNGGKMMVGLGQSLAVVRAFRPHVCFVTGGYVCAPVVMACRLQRVPVLIYLPDMAPGWAIRWLGRLAQRVAVSFPEAAGHFSGEYPQGKAVVTGYPVRRELVSAARDRPKARAQLAEVLQRPWLMVERNRSSPQSLLFIWGGSQGSRNINQAAWAALPQLLPHAQVLHVIGNRDWSLYQERQPALLASLSHEWAERYHPVAYLHEAMPLALAAADLTVARAGASILGEFPVARLPSILAPLPFAGVNQMRNAEQLAKHGAAVIIEDGMLSERLSATVLELLGDSQRREKMEQALAQLAQPDAAMNIAKELCQLGTMGASR
jgi:UDP-N-acetylglucosamine--N-acetylmuramyl-(pentapeptide) pyrophosphoryl-undecaprenol N-acetylglucosamine transferase